MAIAPSSRKRTLVITGASSGIGRELALQGARLGFNVVANARRTARLEALAAEIRLAGGACAIVSGDVTQAATAKHIAETAQREFGGIDVLINNAGMGVAGNLLDQSEAAIDAQWQTHVAAPLRITRAAMPALRASGGQVFFVGSGLARVPAPGFGAYCAAKAAIRAVAIQLRRELRGSGVAVTYVDPGGVDTEFSQAAGMERGSNMMLAKPQDVAARILAAIRTRPATVSGAPLHAVGVAIAAAFPLIADLAIDRIVDKPAPKPAPLPEAPVPEPAAVPDVPFTFERALEPVARRMERVKLPPAFLAELLQPPSELHLHDVAMRWAGMPNKNERAAMAEALDALAAGGFLQKTGDETWLVVRTAG
ncbi:MAG TPA: SDR family NAD(P)-dependent oxidoreductase [Candidatus Baltobacteraceae bacterium]